MISQDDLYLIACQYSKLVFDRALADSDYTKQEALFYRILGEIDDNSKVAFLKDSHTRVMTIALRDCKEE